MSWALATRKRRFSLESNFEITIENFSEKKLNGKLVIPAALESKTIEFDGASIPLPWLAAVLSSGVLRPLGAVLIPSIVHDYLFRRGEIEVNGQLQQVDRETADQLFLLMFQTVSGMRLWPWVAWVAVRAGSPFIPYSGKTRGWNREAVLTLITLLLFFILLYSVWHVACAILFFLLIGVMFFDFMIERITEPYRLK